MKFLGKWLPAMLRGAGIGLVVSLSGCATIESEGAPGDPFEDINRSVYGFNKVVDDALLAPLARGYQAATPEFVNHAVTNFFNNLGDVTNAVNNLLQLKLTNAVEDTGRIALNSTLGLGGLIDFASGIGIARHNEDFGQTLGYWGVSSGPYIVVPFFGASSFRDALGRAADTVFLDPITQIGGHAGLEYSLDGLRIVDRRADLLGAMAILDAATWDEYSFVRDAYTQRRDALIRDGAPAPE